MRINHNIAALNTHRQLAANTGQSSKALEKLSSGLRINRAGDDAAGLAISEKMRAQIRGLDMAQKNAQDSISLIQTGEGAMNEVHSILQRMRELAVQSSNSTNTETDRKELQKEINQLTSEVNRVGNTTEFNTKKLLNGDLSATFKTADAVPGAPVTVNKATTQDVLVGVNPVSWSGTGAQAKFDISFSGKAENDFDWENLDLTATNQLKITKTTDGFQVDFDGTDDATAAQTLKVDADKMAFDATKNEFTYNNHGISFTISGADHAAWKTNDVVTVDLKKTSGDVTTAPINTDSGIQAFTTNTVTTPATDTPATMTGFKVNNADPDLIAGVAKVDVAWTAAGDSLVVKLQDKDGNDVTKTTFSWDGTAAFNYESNGIKFTLDAKDATAIAGTFNLKTAETTVEAPGGTAAKFEDRSLTFQIGANKDQTMSLAIEDVRANALGITGKVGDAGFSDELNVTDGTNNTAKEAALDITTTTSAANAIKVYDEAIAKVSSERAKLGAVQNRLEHTINNLGTSSENLTAAESRIRDVDMAKEMMEFTKNNILTQAAQAMLAQANQQPQGVLQLLR